MGAQQFLRPQVLLPSHRNNPSMAYTGNMNSMDNFNSDMSYGQGFNSASGYDQGGASNYNLGDASGAFGSASNYDQGGAAGTFSSASNYGLGGPSENVNSPSSYDPAGTPSSFNSASNYDLNGGLDNFNSASTYDQGLTDNSYLGTDGSIGQETAGLSHSSESLIGTSDYDSNTEGVVSNEDYDFSGKSDTAFEPIVSDNQNLFDANTTNFQTYQALDRFHSSSLGLKSENDTNRQSSVYEKTVLISNRPLLKEKDNFSNSFFGKKWHQTVQGVLEASKKNHTISTLPKNSLNQQNSLSFLKTAPIKPTLVDDEA